MLQATNIKWDTDGNKKIFEALPSKVDIPEGILGDDEIADYLSDTVGFCHSGYKLTSVVSEEKVPKTDQWNYVDEVGKPTETGIYIVTLIYSECEHGERTGRQVATIDSRDLVDLDKNPSLAVWAMPNEPKTGLAWLNETGDGLDARVYAWLPKQKSSAPKLPEGVVLDDDE